MWRPRSCRVSLALIFLVFFGLAASHPAPAQQRRNSDCIPDAVIPLFQRRAPYMAYFANLLSASVHENYNLLVVWGGGGCRQKKERYVRRTLWWGPPDYLPSGNPNDLLGLFLQERENPGRIHELTIVRNPEIVDSHFRIERLTKAEIVLTYTPEKGRRGPNLRFFFDAASKGFRGQVKYQPFETVGVAGRQPSPQFVLRNDGGVESAGEAPILVFRPADGGGFEAVPESEWAPEIDAEFGTWWSDAAGPARFGPQDRFSLEMGEGWRSDEAIGVREGAELYRLPQSDLEDWRAARPEAQKRGSDPGIFEEAMGPLQVFEGRLWFGKTFYDSEGHSGVGGFGYFDPSARLYVIFSPPAVRDWSVSALLVEKDTVWLGLKARGEWGDSSAGLLRWDRAGRPARKFEIPIVRFIVRWRDSLYLGTEEGLAVVKGNNIENYIVTQRLDSGFDLVRPLVLNNSGQAQPAY